MLRGCFSFLCSVCYTNMETRDRVLPSYRTSVLYWCIWIVHHCLPSCFMAFYSCEVTFLCLFLNFECNEYQHIPVQISNLGEMLVQMAFSMKAGVSDEASETNLRWFCSASQLHRSFFFIFSQLVSLSAFLKLKYSRVLPPRCIFFTMFDALVSLPPVAQCV